MIVIRLKRLLVGISLTLALLLIIMSLYHYNLQNERAVFRAARPGYTVVIDPGHGGEDGGAVGRSGVMEKNINLEIGRKLSLLFTLCGIESKLTRESDISLNYSPKISVRQNKQSDLNARLDMAENTENPVFLSIHLNKFSESKYKGAQVFFSVNHPDGRILAEALQDSLVRNLDPQNNRKAKAADSGIFLTKKLICPAVIVECGFLSNAEEEALLARDEYQKNIAYGILSGYLDFLGQTEQEKGL